MWSYGEFRAMHMITFRATAKHKVMIKSRLCPYFGPVTSRFVHHFPRVTTACTAKEKIREAFVPTQANGFLLMLP